MKSTTTEQMANMFAFQHMTDCMEVTERLMLKDDGWEMTRIYAYADGTTKTVTGEAEGYYYLIPAAPGWVAVTDSYCGQYCGDGKVVRDRHAIAMWRYDLGKHGDGYVMPLIPGDTCMTHAVAVVSPDGRVFEVSSGRVMRNKSYPSVEAWHDHVERERVEHLAEQERRQAEWEKTKCPACGHRKEDDHVPF